MADKISDNKMLAVVAAGALGLFLIPMQTNQKNTADNTANLPATNANVSANSEAILRNSEQGQKDLNNAVQLVRDEINRREPEVVDFVKTLNTERKDDIEDLKDQMFTQFKNVRDDIKEIREQEFDHVNTPRANHARSH